MANPAEEVLQTVTANAHAHAHLGRACCTAAVGQNEKNPHNEKKFGDVSRYSVHSAPSSS